MVINKIPQINHSNVPQIKEAQVASPSRKTNPAVQKCWDDVQARFSKMVTQAKNPPSEKDSE